MRREQIMLPPSISTLTISHTIFLEGDVGSGVEVPTLGSGVEVATLGRKCSGVDRLGGGIVDADSLT